MRIGLSQAPERGAACHIPLKAYVVRPYDVRPCLCSPVRAFKNSYTVNAFSRTALCLEESIQTQKVYVVLRLPLYTSSVLCEYINFVAMVGLTIDERCLIHDLSVCKNGVRSETTITIFFSNK